MRTHLIRRLFIAALAVAAFAIAAPVSAAPYATGRVASAGVVPGAPCVVGMSSSCPIRINFALGAYSGQAHSSLAGITSSRWFVVHLNANQQLTLWVIGKGPTRGFLYFPGGGSTGQPGGRIFDEQVTKTGDYKIKVTESLMAEAWSGRVDVLVVAI